ncbi:MAG: DUF378 domain-containing protein [Chloroflexota bacterium]|jgi:uncharacterized membrane protein YuzA (DUF378 family)
MNFRLGEWISGGLSIVGALNWGLVGIFGFNLVHSLFGWSKPVERLIYATVGLAGLFFAFRLSQSQGVVSEIEEQVESRRPVGVI